MRREFSCSPFTEVKTTWCVPLSGLVAQLPAASAAAQATAAASVRRMTRLPLGPRPAQAPAVDRLPGAEVPRARPWQDRPRELLGAARGGGVLLAELVHAARGVDDLLLAGIERVAVRAHLDLQIVSERRTRLERVAARAGDGDLFVLGMYGGFHGVLTVLRKTLPHSMGRQAHK